MTTLRFLTRLAQETALETDVIHRVYAVVDGVRMCPLEIVNYRVTGVRRPWYEAGEYLHLDFAQEEDIVKAADGIARTARAHALRFAMHLIMWWRR